jgi:hypothetical protein
MDPETSFLLEIRLFGNTFRPEFVAYSLTKVVDSDTTNFKDFLDDVLKSHPSGCNEVVQVLYYFAPEKQHLEIKTDQDMVAMFNRHADSKVIHISIAYNAHTHDPAPIPDVETSPCGKGVPRKESQVTEPSQLAVSQLTESGTQRTEPR